MILTGYGIKARGIEGINGNGTGVTGLPGDGFLPCVATSVLLMMPY